MIDKHADITFQNAVFSLSGDLNFANVMSVYAKSLPYINGCPTLAFDFAQVKSSDSSGLALVIEWVKCARKYQKAIQFKNLSADLISIATASGLDKLLS